MAFLKNAFAAATSCLARSTKSTVWPAPHFIADYNARFGKVPKSASDAHRPLRADEDLDRTLTRRAPRRVSNALRVQYDQVIY
jgi:hypothetical protein